MDMEFSSDEELSTVEGRAKAIINIVQPAVEPPPEKMGRQTTALMRLKGILDRLYRQKVSYFFRNPVDTAVFNVPDYYEIIKQPMDLNTIRLRIQNSYYWNVQEAMDDVELMFDNCMLYNPIHNPVNIAGQEFRAKYRSLLSQIDVTNEQEIIKQTRKPLPKTATVTRLDIEMQQKKAQKRKNQSEIPNTQPGKTLKQSQDVNSNLDGTNVFVLSTADPLYELVPAGETERIAETCAKYLNEFVPGNKAEAPTTSDERLKNIDKFYEYVNGFAPGNEVSAEFATTKEPEAAIQNGVGLIQEESAAAHIQQEEIPCDVSDEVLESIDEAYQYVISFVPGNEEPAEAATTKEPEAAIQDGVDSIQTESADANMQREEIPFDVSDEVVKSIDMFFANNGNQSATDEDQYLSDLCSMNIAEQIAEFNDVFLAQFDTNESAETNTQNDKPHIFDPMIGGYLSPEIADDLAAQDLDFFTTDVYEMSTDVREVIPEEPELGGYSGFIELAGSEAKNMGPVETQQDELNNQAEHKDVDKKTAINCDIKTHVVTSQGVYGTSDDQDVEAYINAYVVTSQDFDSDVLRSLTDRTIDLISPISYSKSRRPSAEKAKIFIHKFKGKELVKTELSEDDVEVKVEVKSEEEDGNGGAKVKKEMKVSEEKDGNEEVKVKEEIKEETDVKQLFESNEDKKVEGS